MIKIPKAGYIQQFLVSKTGWIAVVILPCLGVVIYDILKLIRNVASRGKNLVKKDDRTEEARKKLKEVVEDDEE